VQYLEAPDPEGLRTAEEVRRRLEHALSTLEITAIIVGWHAPPTQLSICRELATEAGVALYRWHPVMSGDQAGRLNAVVGLDGQPVTAHDDNPDFRFGCPNDPHNRALVLNELSRVIDSGLFDGIFLDRIRFPSPTRDPLRDMGCFCDNCKSAARAVDLDLDHVRNRLTQTLQVAASAVAWLGSSLTPGVDIRHAVDADGLLERFLRFRERSIVSVTAALSDLVRKAGMQLGLDCFSPSLTRLVGQALPDLEHHADWTKVMTYAHTNGVAGLPYEFGLLATWWKQNHGALPDQALIQAPLDAEFARAREACSHPMLAGIETVELPGVASPTSAQLTNGIAAARGHGLDGIALSWDLWHTPPERLEVVTSAWQSATPTHDLLVDS